MKSPLEQWQDMQEQNLQLLRSQQDAYLSGIRSWRTQLAAAANAGTTAAGAGQQTPGGFFGVPGTGGAATPTWTIPGTVSADEVAEVNRTYLQKFNELQQDFLRRLTDVITEPQP